VTKLGRAGELAAWSISAVAWALSFAAQMELVAAHGFKSWEIRAWPATPDLAGLTGSWSPSIRCAATAPRWLARVIAVAVAADMVAANIGASTHQT